MTEEDSEECGDVYSLTAIKSNTRLLLFHHDGKRSTEDAIELFNGVEKIRDASSPIPVLCYTSRECLFLYPQSQRDLFEGDQNHLYYIPHSKRFTS